MLLACVFCYVDMAKDFAKQFYRSKTWQRTREAYMKKAGGLCEVCLSQGKYTPGVIVHHKKELTPKNITNPEIALGFENLQLVCRECHMKMHENRRRYIIAEDGTVITK